MRALTKTLAVLSATLNRLALSGALLALGLMVCVVGFQVVARYVFAAPPAWTEEVARHAMIWAGLLGATAAFKANADPTLFPAMHSVAGRLGLLLFSLRAVGVLLFITPVLYFSIFGPNQNPLRGFIMRSLDKTTEVTGISMLFITAAIPVVFTLILIHLLADLSARLTTGQK